MQRKGGGKRVTREGGTGKGEREPMFHSYTEGIERHGPAGVRKEGRKKRNRGEKKSTTYDERGKNPTLTRETLSVRLFKTWKSRKGYDHRKGGGKRGLARG